MSLLSTCTKVSNKYIDKVAHHTFPSQQYCLYVFDVSFSFSKASFSSIGMFPTTELFISLSVCVKGTSNLTFQTPSHHKRLELMLFYANILKYRYPKYILFRKHFILSSVFCVVQIIIQNVGVFFFWQVDLVV